MSSQKKTQRGFTLIEMSIVLVIIGLIVGGILKGQEIIESARQKNMASLYDQIKAAQNTFLDRYRSLPGDFNRASTQINTNVKDGNNDGFVGTGPSGASTAALLAAVNGVAASSEEMNYFNGLIAAQLFGGGQVINGTQVAPAFSGGAQQSPLPSGPWTNTGLTVADGIHEGFTTQNKAAQVSGIWLRLSLYKAGALTTADAPLTVAQAFQMDQKFDDGLAFSGRIRTSGIAGPPCGNATNNTYDVAATTNTNARQCDLMFSMQ